MNKNSITYYVRVQGEPRLAIRVYKTEDGKFHRYIAVISRKVNYEEREIKKQGSPRVVRANCIVSPKKVVTKYLNEYADSWLNNGFKSELSSDLPPNIRDFAKACIVYSYGMNKATLKYTPKRYENDVKLFDWEFRTFYKPE